MLVALLLTDFQMACIDMIVVGFGTVGFIISLCFKIKDENKPWRQRLTRAGYVFLVLSIIGNVIAVQRLWFAYGTTQKNNASAQEAQKSLKEEIAKTDAHIQTIVPQIDHETGDLLKGIVHLKKEISASGEKNTKKINDQLEAMHSGVVAIGKANMELWSEINKLHRDALAEAQMIADLRHEKGVLEGVKSALQALDSQNKTKIAQLEAEKQRIQIEKGISDKAASMFEKQATEAKGLLERQEKGKLDEILLLVQRQADLSIQSAKTEATRTDDKTSRESEKIIAAKSEEVPEDKNTVVDGVQKGTNQAHQDNGGSSGQISGPITTSHP